ncbi:MFS transporter [Candidatus Hydrogenedentota bacterium]
MATHRILRETFFYVQPFLVDCSLGVAGLSIPLFAGRLGASASETGDIVAAGAFMYCIGTLISGRMSDQLGCKPVAITGLFFLATSYLAMGQANRPTMLLVLSGAAGLSAAFFWPPFLHWVGTRRHPAAIMTRLQILCIAWSAGLMAGPWFGGRLYEISTQTAFRSAGCILIVPLVCILLERSPGQDYLMKGGRFDEHISPEKKKLFLRVAWIGNFLAVFAVMSIQAFFPRLAENHLGMSPSVIGGLFFSGRLFMPLSFLVLGFLTTWHYKVSFVVVIQALIILGMVCLLFASNTITIRVAFSAIYFSAAALIFSSLYYTLARSHGQGAASGTHESLIGGGAFLGPLVGGRAAEAFDLRAPYFVCILAVVLAFAIQALLLRRYNVRMRSAG